LLALPRIVRVNDGFVRLPSVAARAWHRLHRSY
jgi:hypothetical protein